MKLKIDPRRVRAIRETGPINGPVFYWMSRDQRAHDNWALLYAAETSLKNRVPLAVVFCLVPDYLGAAIRQYGFMLRGLAEAEKDLLGKDIPLFLLMGNSSETLPPFLKKHKAGTLVADFNPLTVNRVWKKQVAAKIEIPFYEVDTHNIVPVWEASDKAEYAAHLFRKKIEKKMPEFLSDFPALKKPKVRWTGNYPQNDWEAAVKSLKVDGNVPEVKTYKPGFKAGMKRLRDFLKNGLEKYHDTRNNPVVEGQSGLSPYLHFGQISPQRAVIETLRGFSGYKGQESFVNEILVWRELADNFCYYNPDYDNPDGFPNWARTTLDAHQRDLREYLYTLEELENGLTHDSLWNAAQSEMVRGGKMHGYLRMYWAKKILEWTPNIKEAHRIAVYLNDKYQLDGRDPNGYAGIAWSLGGVHDRPWFEREIFGKVRYMSYNGCRGKFDIKAYIKRVENL